MLSPEVFKVDSKGLIRSWQFEVQGEGWRTIAGLRDGKKVVSAFTICTPKSQPTAHEQAIFEAEAEMKKKLKRDYHTSIEGTAKAKYFAPMLAEKYDPTAVEPGDFAQPKLDGIRSVASKIGLHSRKGEVITSCPHISDALESLFEGFPDLILDGELYNHAFKDNFNELTSIIRKQKPDGAQLERAARDIEFHVYDVVVGGNLGSPALDRNAALAALIEDLSDVIKFVPSRSVDNDEDVRSYFSKCVAEGYEGIMVRKGQAPYQQKRSKALMKFKEFQTQEFPVLRIEEGLGNWSGYAKRAVCQLPDGREFGAGIKGDQKFTKALLAKGAKIATIQFFELTPDGVPRFPVAIDFDRPDA